MRRYFRSISRLLRALFKDPSTFSRVIDSTPVLLESKHFSTLYSDKSKAVANPISPKDNPLWDYFQDNKKGNGIWKWEHYFDIYHRHFSKYIGKKVNVLEIGIYSGGSLEMWRSYFGDKSHIYGVDIEPACKEYENENVTVFIGDQEDKTFWDTFKKDVDGIDILIDDGGHSPKQQQTTLEEMLSYLNPGGIYLCEDVNSRFNKFSAFAAGLVNELNHHDEIKGAKITSTATSSFQSAIHSIHFYPFLVIIEKHESPLEVLTSLKRGTEWQPFYNKEVVTKNTEIAE